VRSIRQPRGRELAAASSFGGAARSRWVRPVRLINGSARRPAFTAAAVALALVAASAWVLFVTPTGAAQAGPLCGDEASDERTAVTAAKACARRIEVANRRSEVSRLFANPSGSLTLEQAALPVRARDDSGRWAPIDTGLRRLADGTWAPRVGAARVRASGGGTGPLVTLETNRGSVSLLWSAALPVPRIEGDSAVYPDVFPDVDLRVRVQADGFSHVLVVKTRPAAAHPALRSVRYGLSGAGLRVRRTGDRHEIDNSAGQLLAGLGEPLMWDSTAKAGSDGSTAAVPGGGAKTATPRVTVTADALVLEPDLALLSDPGATLPIYIDPPFSSPWNIWAYSNSAGYGRSMDDARVGEDPDAGGIFRSFFRFQAWDMQGSVILDARFQATLKHSSSCAATYVALYAANDPGVHGQVPWSSNPLNGGPLAIRSGNAHKGPNACGNQPDLPMEFGGPGEWLDEHVQNAATAYASWVTVALSTQQWNWTNGTGYGEDDHHLWKKFQPGSVYLLTTYDHYPNAPVPAAMPATDCYTRCTSPAAVRTTRPSLQATVSDPDAGSQLNTTFEVRATASDTGPLVASNSAAPVVTGTGATAQWQVPSGALANNTTYHWRARSTDENAVIGAWSAWQTMTVDTSPPGAAGVGSTQYPYKRWGAAVGTSGTFTLTAGADVVTFRWSVDGGAETLVPANGTNPKTATVSHTPTRDMVHILSVSTLDAAGNVSPSPYHHEFWVSPMANRCWNWRLDETSGTTATDSGNSGTAGTPCAPVGSSATPMPATMSGAAVWAADAERDRVVAFAGGGQLATGVAVLNTTQAFTVHAWVRFTSLTGPAAQTVLSQSATNTSRFELQYRPDVNGGAGGMCFTMRNSDVVGAAETLACAAAGSVSAAEWVHVAGVYDPVAQQIRLYLRGDSDTCGGEQADAVASFGTGWIDDGRLYIGRGSTTGDAATHGLTGSVDAVYAHQEVLTGGEICQMSLQ